MNGSGSPSKEDYLIFEESSIISWMGQYGSWLLKGNKGWGKVWRLKIEEDPRNSNEILKCSKTSIRSKKVYECSRNFDIV